MKVFDQNNILMIKVNKEEALRLILSLTNQLISNSPNTGRLETYLENDGRDFSIAVHESNN